MSTVDRTPKTIFINHVDLFNGWNLAEYLSTCQVGATFEEEEEFEEENEMETLEPPKADCYEIYGTVSDNENPIPKCIKGTLNTIDKAAFFKRLLDFDIIVYDITHDDVQIDEAVFVVTELQSELENLVKPKIFILISTVLTWAKTKPSDTEDPDIPFTNDDYRRRRAHPNFKEHINAEKTVIKMGKGTKKKLFTYVLAAGIIYGGKEDILHYWFKKAWHNEPMLKCIGSGTNILPTIHVRDLAAVVQNIADSQSFPKYIIVKDESMNTLEEIIKSISKALTTGKIHKVNPEEFFLDDSLEQSQIDTLQVNLRMESVTLRDIMKIDWVSENGIVENIQEMVKEYKESRKLLPLRICILGPPGSGKTTAAEEIASYYKLHHLKINDIINEYIQNLLDQEAKLAAAMEGESDADDEDEDHVEDPSSKLFEINENKEQNNQRLDDNMLVMMVKEKLLSKPCQNQGFVLDGFPKTIDQAKLLYEDLDIEETGEEAMPYNRLTMPEFIFCLEAENSMLSDRIMHLPERDVANTHNTEEGFHRRLAEYRNNNTEDTTVLNFFDELEVHPEMIDVSLDKTPEMEVTIERIKKLVKGPRNYGLSKEILERMKKEELKKQRIQAEKEEAEKEEKDIAEAAERKRNEEEWSKKLSEVKHQEMERLQAQSLPLRNYLMTHIMPTLSKGLIDCCKIRPDDPVDYLSEYLFRNNPQVD